MTAEVTIGDNDYPVYSDLDDVVGPYLDGSFSDAGTAWRDAETDAKKRAMVQATRILNATSWEGEVTTAGQDLAWPRSGLTYADGTEVPDDEIPQQVTDAFCEITGDVILGQAAETQSRIATGVRSLRAGSVSIDYFKFFTETPPFPRMILNMIGLWMTGATSGSAASEASGVDDCTAFDREYNVNRGF